MIFRYKFTTLDFKSEYFYSDLTNCKAKRNLYQCSVKLLKVTLEKELFISFHREAKLPISKFQLSLCMIY